MDERVDFTGGNPDIRIDQILIDPNAHRPAMFAMLSSYAVGTNPNFIISGVEVVVSGVSPNNSYILNAGYVFLNGEILQVTPDAGNFDSTTEFIMLSKNVTYDSRGDITYKDGTPRQTWRKNRAITAIRSSIANDELDAINGDHLDDKIKAYVGDSSTTNKGLVEEATSTEAINLTSDKNITTNNLGDITGGLILRPPIEIGDWDMDGTAEVTVNDSWVMANFSKIRSISAVIQNDFATNRIDFAAGAGSSSSVRIEANSTGVVLTIDPSTSIFQGGAYDTASSFNRGYITIQYLP
jgi:hypothetical protein